MKSSLTLSLIFTLIVSSCGKNSSSGDPNPGVAEGNTTPVEAQPLEGRYEAILRPLNTPVSGFIPSGKAKLSIEGDVVSVLAYLEDDSRVAHQQWVYEGQRCPTLSDDQNGDGFIDTVELQAVVGKALLPLDGDLDKLLDGQDTWPVGKNYTYQKEASASALLQDLYDNRKLDSGSPLNLAGRVIVIHGTSDLARVPETVKSTADVPRNLSIPITCGIVKRLEE